ncbi:hypothetical protein J3Q64DRAFT_1823560 [Phycomyces blakesleeanus]|uniref:Homeodomain-like DNA binding domain-containing transcription factor n=1 Tax=Phycomyces blakesleeanus TaxID=4837 RepID=A0ABR3ATA3_PHYBL
MSVNISLTNQQQQAVEKVLIQERYTFRHLKNLILPTFHKTFNHMSLSLEYLGCYKLKRKKNVVKKIIVKSIASLSDVEKPYLYSGYYKELEPTVTLLKLNDE